MSMLETVSLVILLWTVASVLLGLVLGRFLALTWDSDPVEQRLANERIEILVASFDAPPLLAPTVDLRVPDEPGDATISEIGPRRAA